MSGEEKTLSEQLAAFGREMRMEITKLGLVTSAVHDMEGKLRAMREALKSARDELAVCIRARDEFQRQSEVRDE